MVERKTAAGFNKKKIIISITFKEKNEREEGVREAKLDKRERERGVAEELRRRRRSLLSVRFRRFVGLLLRFKILLNV